MLYVQELRLLRRGKFAIFLFKQFVVVVVIDLRIVYRTF